MSEFYQSVLFKNVAQWETQSVVITSAIAVMGLIILGICIRKCHKV